MRTLLFSVVVILSLKESVQEEKEDGFCKLRHHYRGANFTCCAKVLYDKDHINVFDESDNAVTTCMENAEFKEATKIVARTWLLYRCIVKEKITGELKAANFYDFMLRKFPENVKADIKTRIDSITKHVDRKSSRGKRNARKKREDETNENDPETTTSNANESPAEEAEKTTANKEVDTTVTTETAEEAEKTTEKEVDTTITKETAEVPVVTTDKPSTEKDDTTTPAANNDKSGDSGLENNEESDDTLDELTLYEYLSVFEYIDSFKDKLPGDMEEFVRWWDIYHVAEFEVCNRQSGVDDTAIQSYGTERCLSWIQRTSRGGECCDVVPIPIPLHNNTLMDKQTIQNFVKDNLMSLVGTYTWRNLSFSSNIYRCRRLAVAILQNHVTVDDIKGKIEEFIQNNATTRPPYKEIAEKFIPKFYPSDLEQKMTQLILPATTPTPLRGTNDPPDFVSIDYEWEIQRFNNFENEYQFAIPTEWDLNTLNVNKTRYLMWTCDAYRIISQRISYYDLSEDCY